MGESPIRQTMDDMFNKLAAARLAKVEAEQQIAEYTVALRALAKVMEDREAGDAYLARLDAFDAKAGFTDTIRRLLRERREGFTPLELRGAIAEAGIDLSTQSNAMASIHSVLKRLESSGDVEVKPGPNGQNVYKWTAKGAFKDALQKRTLRKLQVSD